MTEITKYVRHDRPAPRPEPNDPAVTGFLNRFAALERECEDLRTLADRQEVTIATQGHRIEYQDSVIKKLTVQRDSFQRGFLSIQAEMRLFATSAIHSLEVANQEFARDGVEAPATDQGDALDDGARQIGQKFGAGT